MMEAHYPSGNTPGGGNPPTRPVRASQVPGCFGERRDSLA